MAKKGKDINYYNDACALLNSIASKQEADDFIDPKWLGEQEKHNAAESKKLENELKQYKNNLIRESIRVCGTISIQYLTTADRFADGQ